MTNIKRVGSISIDELMKSESSVDDLSEDIHEKPSNKIDPEIDIRAKKKENKYYLPVLHLNNEEMWDSAPLKERRYFTDKVAAETCLSNCCGIPGLKNACCLLDPEDLEHVLGPVSEKWVKKMIKWFKKKGINVTRHDIVIDYEEGRLIGQNHFNGHRAFEQESSYPIIRVQAFGPRFACKFLNVENGMCTIYHNRPNMCRGYYCQFVKKNFLVRTTDKPNTYQKVDRRKEEEK